MNKTALILAGALAFDLCVLVVGAPAADTRGSGAPQGTVVDGKHFPDYAYIRLDAVTSREACVQKGGKASAVKGIPMCQVPAGEAARWTPLVPKPQESNR